MNLLVCCLLTCLLLRLLRCQVLELMTEHLAQWSTSVSFPELSHLPCVALRGFAKGCAVERFRRQAKQLVDALERNATYVGNARDAVSFAPQDLAAAAAFLSSDKERAQVGVLPRSAPCEMFGGAWRGAAVGCITAVAHQIQQVMSVMLGPHVAWAPHANCVALLQEVPYCNCAGCCYFFSC